MSAARKIENPELFRANIRKRLGEFFDNEKHAINLEKGIHNWALKEATVRKVVKKWDNHFFVQIYLDHLRSVYMNLKNGHLVKLVQSAEIKAHEIAFMTHQEMNPERWDQLIKAKIIRDNNKCEQKLVANTDTFTCRKCKSKECNYYALQLRSADEPMTLIILCTICGNRWKQN
jgi:DNA-directed RNA polymerase subunit M/transcription elongation factor TFIIS